MARFAWIIDKDYVADKDAKPPCNANALGLTGPRSAPDELLERLKMTPRQGRKFKMYSDDNELYYDGRILVEGDKGIDGESQGEEYFAPVDNFGSPNAGVTYIKYKDAEGEWHVL